MRVSMNCEDRAALERILHDKRCQKIWPQITHNRAWWLVSYAIHAFADGQRMVTDKKATRAARKSERAKKMAKKPLPRKRHHRWGEMIEALGEVREHIGRNSTQINATQFAMHGDLRAIDAPSRWQSVIDEIIQAFHHTHRSLERLDHLLAKPVPASRKWDGAEAAKRHVVLSLYLNLSEKSVGIDDHKRPDFTARLASAALNLSDHNALDSVAVGKILAGTRRRGLSRQK
jgi:hypothetical protein